MSNVNVINDSDSGNEPVVLDEFRESLRVRSGQHLQTGDHNSVVTEGGFNRVVVEKDASIDSNQTAIEANGVASTVFNQGLIDGGVNGVSATGNRFRLLNRGTIESDSRAVDISDGDGSTVINSGSILGTDNQRNGTLYVDGTVDHFRLLNQRSGIIDAGKGNLGDAVSVQVGAAGDPTSERIHIVNHGLFQGRGDGSAVFADGTRVAANGSSGLRFFNGSGQPETSVSGSVINNGAITAEVNVGFLGGLVVEDGVGFDGQIVNGRDGLIEGPRNGLYIGNADHDLTLRNFGTIQSGSRAVNIDGSGVDLRNFGQILGTDDQRNGTVYSDATAENYRIVNGRNGVIDAGIGNQGAGIALQTGDVVGDVVHATLVNRGTIQGRGQAAANLGLAGDGLRIFSGVDGGGTIYRGNIVNRGDILSESTQGATAAVRFSDGLAYEGTLTNARGGLIDGAQNGLYFGDAEHDATVINRGIIQSGSRAVNIDGSGVDLRNFGHILGTGDQRNGTVYADSTAEAYSILNGRSGLIDAGEGNNGAGVSLQTGDQDGDIVEASLRNDGIIRGRGDGTGNQAGDGIRLFTSVTGSTTFAGDLDNRGRILGTDDGIDIQAGVTLDGDINNSGLIAADEIGVHISGALKGALNNRGTLTGGAAAIDASAATTGITINNQGEINGDATLSNFDDIFNGAEGTVNGVIDGGGGNDLLIGSRQNENFVGGNGQDTFVFGTNSGTDFILDFSISSVHESDVLDLSAVFSDIDEILGIGGAATQVGTSTLIDLGNNDSVFLVNVSVNDLTADNFIL
ncbi:calcium-binding protein [Acaryochloris sp. IP29b_bin.148]|uniref:beta strand repeat-containing protein n=1 Tax=Acaryochloris sp. IP29b_bin.148 TaxID=2969218 RepID=UPI0026214A4E|nr:calcium-binding protein [Acaryochloris sp. IP29b_bin.148]